MRDTAGTGAPDLDAVLRAGATHHRAGRLREAEAAYRRILAVDSGHPEATHLLGVVAYQQEKHDAAHALIAKAIAARPESAEFHNNLGLVLQAQGKFDDAVAAYRRALAVKPDLPEVHNNLGNALRDRGDRDAAVAAYRRALELNPDYADAHNGLGIVLMAQNQNAAAAAAFRRAIGVNPSYAEAFNNLGKSLKKQDLFEGARAAFRRAAALKPDYVDAHFNLGQACFDHDELDEAVTAYRRGLAIRPDRVQAWNNLGAALQARGDVDAAVAAYHRALEIEPEYAKVLVNLAVAQGEQGKLEDAVATYRRVLEIEPDNPLAHLNLSYLKRYQEGDPEIAAMERLVADADTADDVRLPVCFALGKAYDDVGDHDGAFEAYARGNALKRARVDYDTADMEFVVDTIIETFTAELFAANDGAGCDSALPIFIVGMPRSGTTLVEQILASHPEVHGAGELRDLVRLTARLSRRVGASSPYPRCVPEVTPEQWRALGEGYAEQLRAHHPTAARITDKLPGNFQRIGLIHLMFPNAPIVHCVRDPLDTCVSCFRTLFSERHEFSYDLRELGLFYRLYERIMAHWRALLPHQILDVRYEDVVGDLAGTARRLVAFCGLEWDDACLAFPDAERPVRTASFVQVRRPIYASSVGGARRYADHLGPLVDALGERPDPTRAAKPSTKRQRARGSGS